MQTNANKQIGRVECTRITRNGNILSGLHNSSLINQLNQDFTTMKSMEYLHGAGMFSSANTIGYENKNGRRT